MKRTPEDVARTRAFWLASKPGEPAAPAFALDPPLWWHVALALALGLLAQSTLGPFLEFGGATISVVALLVAWYGVRSGTFRGLAFGLFAGACEDALAGTSGVAWTFASGLIGMLAGRFAGTWLADTTVVLVPAAALLTFVRYGAFFIIMQVQGRPLALLATHVHVAVVQSVLDALAALIVLHFVPSVGGAGAHRR